ncbi:site-specific integrase [Algiphilus sp.]|uniref:integrase n=1 Tax=Algiphilus sp. TaxID=1872431 RepID=UPI0025BAF158|nr:site-specific integrase [Algiphilus sp.]MCK5770061.1 tyrosine-type recombinase/integrase [Algiphilus sp.]
MAYYKKRQWYTLTTYKDGRTKRTLNVRHDFRVVLPGGQRVTRTFKNLDAGKRWVAEQERLIELGADALGVERSRDVTVGAILDRYMREVAVSLKSMRAAKGCADPLRRELGQIPLSALTPERVGEYRDTRLKQRRRRGGGTKEAEAVELDRMIQPSTVKKELAFLSRVIDVATKAWGYRLPLGNPARGVDRPSEGDGRDRRLVGDEESRLLAAASGNPVLRNAIILLIETAARRGELWAVEWRDIDYESRTLHLRAEDPGAAKTGTAKTRRVVPLTPRAVEAFKALEPKRKSDRQGRVFRIEPSSVSQAFGRACARAGIDELTLHDLRHEGTSRLFELGLNMMEVSAITGHKTLDMLKRYTQLRAEQIGKRMETLLAPESSDAAVEVQLAAILKELEYLRHQK